MIFVAGSGSVFTDNVGIIESISNSTIGASTIFDNIGFSVSITNGVSNFSSTTFSITISFVVVIANEGCFGKSN